jgi:tetratricopeptide (TPR) repeat protein
MLTLDLKTLAADAVRVYQEGDFENAARLFGEAASAFQAQGNDLDAAEMKNNQSVALLQQGNAKGSLDAALGTPEVFSAGGDFRREGMAFGNLATALAALGRMDEAANFYRQAAAALEKAGEDQLRASVMQALAGIQLRKGKIMEALVSMQMGLVGVKNPTFKQKILRGLLRLRTW